MRTKLSWREFTIAGPGIFCSLLGASTLAARALDLRLFWAQAVPNAAFGLMLDGFGLAAIAWRRGRMAIPGAVWSILLGAATLAEYLFSIDLYIDRLMIGDSRPGPFPGRIGPNGAFCFILSGVVLWWASLRRPPWRWIGVMALLSGVVCSASLASLVSRFLNLPFYGGWSLIAPRLGTLDAALGFALLGSGLLMAVWRSDKEQEGGLSARLMLSAAGAGVLVAVCFGQALSTIHSDRTSEIAAVLGLPPAQVLMVMRAVQGNLALVLAGLGVVISLLMVLMLNQTLASRRLAHDSQIAAEQLRSEFRERQQAEGALRRSEERYRALALAAQIVWTASPDGLVTDIPSWRAFTGQTEEQVKGWGWTEALFPADREPTMAVWSEAVRSRSIYITEYRILRRDGEYRHMAVRGVPVIEADGSIREWVGTCTDVTERKQADEALARKAAELERSNAELQRFAYVASHDLQEPLRMVTNFTQLLADRYASKLDSDAREFIAFAIGGATRMQKLIQDLLAYSRVGSCGKPFEPVDCNEALGRAVVGLQFAIRESAALVGHNELPTITADLAQITHLFQNLIGNALKFKGSDPPRIHVSAARDGSDWIFSVRDNGIGIEPRYFERIFVIFQRLHRPEDYPGTGIGLALCKRIVERHGGQIWVKSQPGKGSTFYFRIPAAVEPANSGGTEVGARNEYQHCSV